MKHYYICDNRDAIYCVFVLTDKVVIYSTVTREIVHTIHNPVQVFIGRATDEEEDCGPEYDGNTILVQIGELQYVHIGGIIFSFYTKEPVIDYISNMGNNLEPYPYAVTDSYVYLMLEENILPKMKDPYKFYYAKDYCTTEKNPYENFETAVIHDFNDSEEHEEEEDEDEEEHDNDKNDKQSDEDEEEEEEEEDEEDKQSDENYPPMYIYLIHPEKMDDDMVDEKSVYDYFNQLYT